MTTAIVATNKTENGQMQSSLTNFNQRVLWRINDFCQAHGIGRTLVYEEIKRGELKIIKVGNRTLIPDSEAKAWQERKARASK